MAKMRVNTIEIIRQNAINHVNLKYMVVGHYMAHHRKRQLAEDVLAGKPATPEFIEAASIEAMTTNDLAKLIVSKPDELMQADNNRRRMLSRINAAKTADELHAIMLDIDVPTSRPGTPYKMPDNVR